MRTLIFLVVLAIAGLTQSPLTQKPAQAAEIVLVDPSEVVSKTCAPASSPLCRCIVSLTVKTLEAGPREVLALARQPDTVWEELVKTLDPAQRASMEGAKTAAEHDCRRRLGPGSSRITTMDRMVRAAKRGKPKRSLRSSCSSEGGSSAACDCYEKTLGAALTPEDFDIVREDASFPPLLEEMPADRRRMALAAMASARAACGVGV